MLKSLKAFGLAAGLVVTAQIATGLAAVSLVVFGALWLGLRREPVYGAFALAAACFFVNSLNYHWQEPPFPRAPVVSEDLVHLGLLAAGFGA